MAPPGRSSRERVAHEAAEWVVRLADSGCDDAEHARLQAWLREDPAHELAFERESLAWERTERLRALRPGGRPAADLMAEFEPRSAAKPRPRPRRSMAPWRFAAAALLCVTVAGGGYLWLGGESKAYATAVGERRVVVLSDGSRLELNTDTQVVVRMSRTGRRAKLVRGEALFEVRRDRRGPFVVAVRDEELRGVDGAFNVRLAEDAVRVAVLQGEVAVHGRAGPDAVIFDARLPAGSFGAYGAVGAQSRYGEAGEIDRTLSWRYGTIALSGQTLGDAAAEFNRYNTKRLVIADPSIAGLRFGGYFRETDVEGFARALQTSFGIQASDTGSAIYLSRAGAPRRPPAS